MDGEDPVYNAHADAERGPTKRAIHSIQDAILNEKNAPEILPYQAQVVEELSTSLQQQESTLESMERQPQHDLMRMVFNLEAKRIRYMLRLYLRTRLHKLEAFAAHLLRDDAMLARLSPLEQKYTHDYFVLAARHLKTSFLNHLPEDLSSVIQSHIAADTNDLVAEPALDAHVFCSLLEDAGSVQLGEDQVVDMKQGDLFIVRYESIASLVQQGKAVLV